MATRSSVFYTPGNNHGCRGQMVAVEVLTDTTGNVVEVSGEGGCDCYNCPLHGRKLGIREGEVVSLPDYVFSWEEAGAEDIGGTYVRPDELQPL